jgi:hypothetical protein
MFGFTAPKHLRWTKDGREVKHWYTGRMEHLHELPVSWDLENEFRKIDAWLSLDVDDMTQVSVPWAHDESVTWRDSKLPQGTDGSAYPILVREYDTPAGSVRHAVRQTNEDVGPGWVTQPDYVPLFEDFNIPRGVEHLVSQPEDVDKVRWLYQGPDAAGEAWLADRMAQLVPFAQERGLMMQAWAGYGVDAAVWLAGAEGAIMLYMDHRGAFKELLDIIQTADMQRIRAVLHYDVDMVVSRGWYSSTDFRSPRIFKELFTPKIAEMAALAHEHGKLFGYVMTTGVMPLGRELIDAGVDLLYYVDPEQADLDMSEARELFGGHLAVAGGINSAMTLAGGSAAEIRSLVKSAIEAFGRDGGFILSPVDTLFPDTPPANVEIMIAAWRKCARV